MNIGKSLVLDPQMFSRAEGATIAFFTQKTHHVQPIHFNNNWVMLDLYLLPDCLRKVETYNISSSTLVTLPSVAF